MLFPPDDHTNVNTNAPEKVLIYPSIFCSYFILVSKV